MKAVLPTLVLGFLALAACNAPANAQTTPSPGACPSVYPIPPYSGWPNGTATEYCGSSTLSNGYTMADAIGQAPGTLTDAATKVAALRASFYLFGQPSEVGGSKPGNNSYSAFTLYSGDTPMYTVVLQKNGAGVVNGFIGNSAAHEFGHWADYVEASVVQKEISRVSDSTLFADEIAEDWARFNANGPCFNQTTSSSGPFQYQQDSTGKFICTGKNGNGQPDGSGKTLNSGYSGNNQAVLNQAWPMFFNQNKEVFAEEVAILLNNADTGGTQTLDHYLTGNYTFQCIASLERNLLQTGTVPAAGTYPTGCPTK